LNKNQANMETSVNSLTADSAFRPNDLFSFLKLKNGLLI